MTTETKDIGLVVKELVKRTCLAILYVLNEVERTMYSE